MDEEATGTIDDATREAVGKLVSEIRKRGKMSQPEFAQRVGLSPATVSNVERGKRVSDDTLVDVALALAPHTERILEVAGIPMPDIEPWESPGDDFYPVTSQGQGADRLASIEATLGVVLQRLAELRSEVDVIKQDRA